MSKLYGQRTQEFLELRERNFQGTVSFINTNISGNFQIYISVTLKESFLKVGDLFLHKTSPILVTFTRFVASTLRKVRSTCTLKHFYRRSYIFGLVTHLLMEK